MCGCYPDKVSDVKLYPKQLGYQTYKHLKSEEKTKCQHTRIWLYMRKFRVICGWNVISKQMC